MAKRLSARMAIVNHVAAVKVPYLKVKIVFALHFIIQLSRAGLALLGGEDRLGSMACLIAA